MFRKKNKVSKELSDIEKLELVVPLTTQKGNKMKDDIEIVDSWPKHKNLQEQADRKVQLNKPSDEERQLASRLYRQKCDQVRKIREENPDTDFIHFIRE